MSALPQEPAPGQQPLVEKDLRAIRAALVVPEDIEAFESGLEVAFSEAKLSRDLSGLHRFIHEWWLHACDSVRDPEGRRQMHAVAAEIMAGRIPPGTRPAREVLAERGIEL